jgi:hypothetical protein
MTKCKNCDKEFSRRYVDENGKQHNTQNRKYCMECSPFNNHNTSKLELIKLNTHGKRICTACGSTFESKRRHICNTCNDRKKRQKKKNFLMSIVGYNCWNCGYGGSIKYAATLEMHHVNDEDKLFALHIDMLGRKSNEEIINEAKKCVLLCCRCHREYHYTDLITTEQIKKLHLKWDDIDIKISLDK